jgi:hypothetical protein
MSQNIPSSQSSVSMMARYESDAESDKENQDEVQPTQKTRGKDKNYRLAEENLSLEEALSIIAAEKIWSKTT